MTTKADLEGQIEELRAVNKDLAKQLMEALDSLQEARNYAEKYAKRVGMLSSGFQMALIDAENAKLLIKHWLLTRYKAQPSEPAEIVDEKETTKLHNSEDVRALQHIYAVLGGDK